MNGHVDGNHVNKFMQSELAKGRPDEHRILSEEELVIFRTQLCEAQCNGSCPDPDRCSRSHCLTWQRRNPMRILYSPSLCPDIEFVRRNSRMALLRRCNRGRSCPYAHSKEEELYHPMVYKTKLCKVFPNCKRYHCPFAHTVDELRRRMTAEEYRAAKVAACDTSSSLTWHDTMKGPTARCRSPGSIVTSALTTEASSNPAAVGHLKHPLPKSPLSARIPLHTIGHGSISPRSSPVFSGTFPLGSSALAGLYHGPLDALDNRFPHSNASFPSAALDPFEAPPSSATSHTDMPVHDDLLKGLESLIERISQLQLANCQVSGTTSCSQQQQQQPSGFCAPAAPPKFVSASEDDYETLWKEIAQNLVLSGSGVSYPLVAQATTSAENSGQVQNAVVCDEPTTLNS